MTRTFTWFFAVGLLSCGVSLAGNNAGGTARLSWDEAGNVETRAAPPSTRFPLYLQLLGAPDIQQLAVTLFWVPVDSTRECLGILPAIESPTCGWAVPELPTGAFEGDATYTWSIRFPAGSADRSCVEYLFSMVDCDSVPPAKFYVADCRVKDSNGEIDTLQNVGDVKLIGGPLADTLSSSQYSVANLKTLPPSLALTAAPNPASATTTLRFRMTAGLPYVLSILDVNGRVVQRVTGTCSADGSGSFVWDLRDRVGRPAHVGLYFARLATLGESRALPLIVLR